MGISKFLFPHPVTARLLVFTATVKYCGSDAASSQGYCRAGERGMGIGQVRNAAELIALDEVILISFLLSKHSGLLQVFD